MGIWTSFVMSVSYMDAEKHRGGCVILVECKGWIWIGSKDSTLMARMECIM